MKSIIVVCAIAIFLSGACSSKPKAVNAEPTSPILPMVAPSMNSTLTLDSLGRAPTAAIEGKVVLENDLPTPLSNVQLGLYRNEKGHWQEITQLSSAPDGHFRITQKLLSGDYEIRVISFL